MMAGSEHTMIGWIPSD